MTKNCNIKRLLPIFAMLIALFHGFQVLAQVESDDLENLEDVQLGYYKKIGPLDAYVIENVKGAPYIVYLHGYGGIGQAQYEELRADIVGSDILKQINWIFPDGPYFDIANPLAWQESLIPGRKALSQMLAAAKISQRDVIWAGFSMGAVTATDYVLHARVPALGLITSSGFYFDSTDWKQGSPHLKGIKFVISHSRKYDMFPFYQAKKLEKLLKENGMKGRVVSHLQAHVVPPGFLEKAVSEVLNIKMSARSSKRPSRKLSKNCWFMSNL